MEAYLKADEDYVNGDPEDEKKHNDALKQAAENWTDDDDGGDIDYR